MRPGVFALSLIGFLAIWQACEAQHIFEYRYCGYRISRVREGQAHFVMKVERIAQVVDHGCPEEQVQGRVLRTMHGRLKRNDPVSVSFPLAESVACGPLDSGPDAILPDVGQHVVVLFDENGALYWMESVKEYDRREAECREPGVVEVR